MSFDNNKDQTEQCKQDKKGESKKFLKIYMLSFLIVVVGLITLSFFSQERLNVQIEELSQQVDNKQNEALNHLNSAEELQNFIEQQEELIEKREKTIEDYHMQMYDYAAAIKESQSKLQLFDDYIVFVSLYDSGYYSECVNFAYQIVNNELYVGMKNKILLNEDLLNSEQIMLDGIYNKTEIISESEEIQEMLSQDDKNKLENIQDMR